MTVASLRAHTAAVIARLESGGLLVGDGDVPKDDNDRPVAHGWQKSTPPTFVPYVVVYPLGGLTEGGYVEPNEDADLSWQVTCLGGTRNQAEWVVDRCNELLEGVFLTVAGRSLDPLDPELEAAGVRRDDDVSPPVFYATPRYRAVSRPT